MPNSKQEPDRSRSSGRRGARRRSAPDTSGLESAGNTMVLLTIAAVALAVLVKVDWLTPIVLTAAVFPFFYAAMKEQQHAWALVLTIRWMATALLTTIGLGVFVPARMAASQLLSERVVATLQTWLTSSPAAPPADYSYLLWGLAAFLVASVISGGVAAFAIAAVALGGAAVGSLFLFEHGNNVVQITLTAIPPWQWSLFACGTLLLAPTAKPFFDRFVRSGEHDHRFLMVTMYAGAACFALGLLLRLALGGVWQSLLRHWTSF